MDLHISVIEDFKNIFSQFEITHWCLSSHAWVFKRTTFSPKHINPNNWIQLNEIMISRFHEEYDTFLQTFDGFICGHPNSFAMIFEKYNKPIILINSCRYDMPFCFTKNIYSLENYQQCLHRLNKKNLLIAVSNNKADQLYIKLGCGINTTHIPSLCDYTGMKYNPIKNTFLCYSGSVNHPLITQKIELGNQYSWKKLAEFKGIIHFPYEISTMSIFEQYSSGIPLFFPSKKYMIDNCSIQSISAYWNNNIPDNLSLFKNKEIWINLADFYTTFRSPNIYIFDSIEHLFLLIENFEWKDDSYELNAYKDTIKNDWKMLLDRPEFKDSKKKETTEQNILKDEIITTDKYLEAFQSFYYKTDVIKYKQPIQWRGTLHNPPPKNLPVIISGHSDYHISDDLVQHYSPEVWWCVNKQTSHNSVHSLPLGITNNTNESHLHPIYGNLDSMIQVMNEPKQDINLVYMNFNQDTHSERKFVYNMFNHKSWITIGKIENTLEGRTNFLREIRNHTFVLCPRGNGIDTHRLWESLYMGSIPIVKRDIAFEEFNDLPICFINDWTQITEDFLKLEEKRIKSTVWNLDKLKVSYWVKQINQINQRINQRINQLTYYKSINSGQVKLQQKLGKFAKSYAEDNRFTRYMEIGTWNGRGSTVCFAAGLVGRTNATLVSLETNAIKIKEATSLWNDNPKIKILHARIFTDDEIPTFEVIKPIHNYVTESWHKEDIDNCISASYFDVKEYNPEVVMLDGGEYMTYFEYLILKDIAKVFLLDDTYVSKCNRIVKELSSNPEWKLIDGNYGERNGWHVFEKSTI